MEDCILFWGMLAHCYFDNYLKDGSSGLFAVFDGHGGIEVVEYVTKVLPEVNKY